MLINYNIKYFAYVYFFFLGISSSLISFSTLEDYLHDTGPNSHLITYDPLRNWHKVPSPS